METKNNKKIILGIIVLVILAGTGYFFFAKNKGSLPSLSGLPNLPIIGGPSEKDLQGKWRVEQFFMFDGASKQFKEVPPERQQTKTYVEFKGNLLCMDGKISAEGYPVPCAKYVPFTVAGQKISAMPDGSTPATYPGFEWTIKGGKLELVADNENPSQKIKVVLNRFEASPTAKTIPSELKGVWKPAQSFGWDATARQFRVETPSLPQNAYIEFKEGFMCEKGIFNEQGAVMPCMQYDPAVFEGDTIRTSNAFLRWAVKDGKLELTLLAEGGIPTHKLVLIKVP